MSQRFVQEQNFRLADKSARDSHPLLLTARKRIYVAVTVILKPHHFKGVIDFVGYFGFCEFARLFYRVTLFVRLYSVVKFLSLSPKATFLKTLRCGKSAYFWNTVFTGRR